MLIVSKSTLKNKIAETPTIVIVEGECPDLTYKSIEHYKEHYVNFNTGSNCVSFDKETNTIVVYTTIGAADGYEVVKGICNSVDKIN